MPISQTSDRVHVSQERTFAFIDIFCWSLISFVCFFFRVALPCHSLEDVSVYENVGTMMMMWMMRRTRYICFIPASNQQQLVIFCVLCPCAIVHTHIYVCVCSSNCLPHRVYAFSGNRHLLIIHRLGADQMGNQILWLTLLWLMLLLLMHDVINVRMDNHVIMRNQVEQRIQYDSFMNCCL